jgi:hypothetical protein
MNLGQFLEKFGRTMFERPLATSPDPEEPPELAEIRLAILDQVREKSYRSGGRKVFPYDLLRVSCAAWSRAASRRFRRPVLPQVPGAGSAQRAPHRRVPVSREPAGGRGRHGGPAARGEAWLVVEAVSLEQAAGGGKPAARLVRCGKARPTPPS